MTKMMDYGFWTKTKDGYVSEISTLDANRAMVCPVCNYPITLGLPIRDKSSEIIKWTHKCRSCKSFMQIFND